MERGILLEKSGRQAVVITPKGEFLRLRAGRDWQVGGEVTFIRDNVYIPAPRRGWFNYLATAAVIGALALGITLYSGVVPVEAAVATVTVDINPSVQLEVSARGNVVSATALNAEGEKILAAVDFKKQPVDEVVAALTDAAIQGGYLDPAAADSLVVIAAKAYAGEELSVTLSAELEHAKGKSEAKLKEAARGQDVNAHVIAVQADAATEALAKAKKITLGEAATAQVLEKMGIKVDVDDLSRKSAIGALREQAKKDGTPPGQLVKELEHQLHELLPLGGKGRGSDDKGKPDQGKSDLGKSDQGKPDQGKPDQGKSDQGKSDQGKSDQGKSGKDSDDKGQQDKDKGDPKNNDKDRGQTGISIGGGIHIGVGSDDSKPGNGDNSSDRGKDNGKSGKP